MSVETTVGGTLVGLETPVLLAALPAVAALLAGLLGWRTGGAASGRSRRLLFASRLVVATLLVVAAAGPYTVATRETRGNPTATVLVDESESMAVMGSAEGLAADIEAEGVPTTVATVGNGTRSRIGDGIVANLQQEGSVLVVSDGQVTEGRSLASAGEVARSLNATVSAVDLRASETERYVTVNGPSKTSTGIESTFLVSVRGVETAGEVPVTVQIDGEEVESTTLEAGAGAGTVEVSHVFDETGPHRVTARMESADRFGRNDVAYHSVRVVEQPEVLYVGGSTPLRSYLGALYDLETADNVPGNLTEYYAVVVQDRPADRVGNVSALQEFVIEGGGLVVGGGRNSFDRGGYDGSAFASMLPVTTGETGPGTSRLVLVVDVSGSTQAGMRVQKAIALDVLDQLGDGNEVGIVAFNYQPYAVAEPRPLGENRGQLEDRIRRLTAGGATDIAAGLRGAEEMLGPEGGTAVLISDGVDDSAAVGAAADRLGRQGTRVVAVGVGNRTDEASLTTIARGSGGVYLRPGETERLRIRYGGASRTFEGDGLTIVDPNTFVTSGVELTATPGAANEVSTRRGADLLVATSSGDPAVARWRYGLGRVLTLTAHDEDGTLGGLLRQPDSLLVTKSVNYAVGDPERKASGTASAPDTRVGESTTVTYRGSNPPNGAGFRRVAPDRYEVTVTPREAGFQFVGGAEYAANYPAEYGAFGRSPELDRLVRSTGGERFEAGEAAAISRFVRRQASAVREVRDDWGWFFALLALVVFLTEVVVRRLQVYRGATRRESGLP